jgi:hypothetical protein
MNTSVLNTHELKMELGRKEEFWDFRKGIKRDLRLQSIVTN